MTLSSCTARLKERKLLSQSQLSDPVYSLLMHIACPHPEYDAGAHFIFRPPNSKKFILQFFAQKGTELPTPEQLKTWQWNGIDLSRPSKINENAFLPMRKRYYSIASSSSETPDHVLLIVRHLNKDACDEAGSASYYLCKEMALQETIHVDIRSSCFCKLPATPIIFIATGTGIAAFRGILIERSKEQKLSWLIFGDRDEENFMYQNLWNTLAKQPSFTFSTAFSKNRTSSHFQYVQNILWHNREKIWYWLKCLNAKICLAGSPSMGKSVLETLENIAQDQGKEADWLKKQLQSDHILQELY